MEQGHILFLNGTSSAGKSTLAWEIQNQGQARYYWLSNDAFTDMPHNSYYERDRMGTFSEAIHMMYKTARLYVESGLSVILDHVLLDDDRDEELTRCAQIFKGIHVLFVFVKCPLEELNRREVARADREIGNAARQYPHLYPEGAYDIVVNTHENTTEACAQMVLRENARLLKNPGAATAFARLFKNGRG